MDAKSIPSDAVKRSLYLGESMKGEDIALIAFYMNASRSHERKGNFPRTLVFSNECIPVWSYPTNDARFRLSVEACRQFENSYIGGRGLTQIHVEARKKSFARCKTTEPREGNRTGKLFLSNLLSGIRVKGTSAGSHEDAS